jgi:hypothetical protein
MNNATKIDLRRLPAADAMARATAAMREAEREREALGEQRQQCAELEAKAAEAAASVTRLRDRRIDLLADQLGGADVADALAENELENAQAEAHAAELADQGAAAAQVRQRLDARMGAAEDRRQAAERDLQAARYALLTEAAEREVANFRRAREAMEAAYGAMAAALTLGSLEAIATRQRDPNTEQRVLCNVNEIHKCARQATWTQWPVGSPFFDQEAERQRAGQAAAMLAAWDAAKDSIRTQLAELSEAATA